MGAGGLSRPPGRCGSSGRGDGDVPSPSTAAGSLGTRSGGGKTAGERVRHGASPARAVCATVAGEEEGEWSRVGQRCPLGPSVILHPAVLRDERVYHLLHGEVGDQLVLGQGTPRHRIEMTHALQGRRKRRWPQTGYSTRPTSAPGHGQVATRPAPCRYPARQPRVCRGRGKERCGARVSPLKVPPSGMRAGQGTRPLPRAASASGSAQRVPGTKSKEAFEPFGGQAAAFTPRQRRSAGKVLGSPHCPLPAWWYLEMFLDVLPVVGDAAGRDAGLSHQLKTDLPAQVVRDVPLLVREREARAGSGGAGPAQHQ